MSGTVGSGIWTKMKARLGHLLRSGGMSGEVRDVRLDIAAVFKPMVAVAVEEYAYPPAAGATVLLAATLSTNGTAQSYNCNGAQGIALSPPRNVEIVVAASGTPTHMAHSATVSGLDANGNKISEVITGLNGGGGGTYAGAKCFALVEKVVTSADGGGIDATFTVYNGVVIGLSQLPKLRTGQTLGLIRRELVDGAAPSAGALTAPATNAPNGAYTPVTAPTTEAPATTTGSADVTAAGLYGAGGTLAGGGTGLVLDMTVNGVHAAVTFDGTATTGSDSEPHLLAFIAAHWPGLVATLAGVDLKLTTSLSDQAAALVIAANGTGTANVSLGLTAGTYHGAGHRYAIEYEYDASVQTDPNSF